MYIFCNYIPNFLPLTAAISLLMDSGLYLIPNFVMTYSNSCIHSLKEKLPKMISQSED